MHDIMHAGMTAPDDKQSLLESEALDGSVHTRRSPLIPPYREDLRAQPHMWRYDQPSIPLLASAG